MSHFQEQRPSFFEGQYLGAEDLTAAVEYARLQQARHALGAHTWGIAMGLQLVEKPAPSSSGQMDVFVQPGYAWDGFGRPITVLAPYKVPAELFKPILCNAACDNGTPPGRLVEVWLRYHEQAICPPRPGFPVCEQEQQFARVQEQFRLEVGARLPDEQRDNISVAGRAVDAQEAEQMLNPHTPPVKIFDASIPYQHFPAAEERRRWLIPLGSVRWQPHTDATQLGRFVQRTPEDKALSEKQRRYIGVVAGVVHAAANNIRMRDRTKAYSQCDYSDELVWVEGKLRVDGDVRLFGGQLDFRDTHGEELELHICRRDSHVDNTRALQVVIGPTSGPAAQPTYRFAVGTLQSSGSTGEQAMDEKFVVRGDGNVGIGTTNPRNRLGVRARGLSEELLSFEDPIGRTKWHINQNLRGKNPGLNFAETDVADGDGRLFIKAGGNVGIGTETPAEKLDIRGHIKLHPDGSLFAPGGLENLRILRGNLQTTPVSVRIESGRGFTVTLIAVSFYEIAFDLPFSARPSATVTQVISFDDFDADGDTRNNAVIVGLNAQRMRVKTGDGAGTAQNRSFSFIVIGPR